MHDMDDIFGVDGPLASAMPDFRARASQSRMAERVADALAAREPLLVEAGTGTGKTFAYLVPALLSGKRVLISTGTRTLQDQLFAKDLPLVGSALGMPLRAALLKGRSNYLCRYRMLSHTLQRDIEGVSPMMARVERWSGMTATGDLAEVPGLSEADPLWGAITSTRDNCLGQRCDEYSKCHVVAARRAAHEADIVVVNHHLLLADLALKQDGFGDLLGAADAVILDEAHQLPDLATQFFGATVASRQVEILLADARAAMQAAGISAAVLAAAARGVEESLNATLGVLPRGTGRVGWEQTQADLESFVLSIADAVRKLGDACRQASDAAPVAQCAARALQLADLLERIARNKGENGNGGVEEGARTVEATARHFTLSLLPFDISARFRGIVEARPAAWVFTSATLSVGEDFSHFATALGLDAADTLHIASPFDYERQALLYLPEGMPDTQSPAYLDAVVELAVPLIDAARGGAFLLFTSHRALQRAAGLLREHWAGEQPYPLLVQGDGPRERLLREFREHGSAVLLGTASFWEGVDVKGSALRLVVIEKLPFASPEDPLVKARIEHLKLNGGNAFREYQLPEAVIALKQGVGRLIRDEDDSGVVVICDPRLTSKSYGRVFHASLPPLRVTRDGDEVRRFLRIVAGPIARAAARPLVDRLA